MKCIMPYSNIEIRTDGTFGPCCINHYNYKDRNGNDFNISTHTIDEVWNSTDRREYAVRLDNQDLTDCRRCWIIEKNNGYSKRLFENDHRTLSDDNAPASFDIKFGNVCNLKCTMCSPEASSLWISDFNKLYNTKFNNKGKYDWPNRIDISEYLKDHLDNVDILEFYGGEPMLVLAKSTILDECISRGVASNISIRMNTNGTILFTDAILTKLSKFKSVGINVSIDSFDKSRLRYQRYPADVDEIMTNYDKLYNCNLENLILNITYTVNILSVFDLCGLDTFGKQYPNSQIHLNILHDPYWLSLRSLTEVQSKLLLDKLNCEMTDINIHSTTIDDIRGILKDNQTTSNDIVDWLNKMDKIRTTDWREVFPELSEILK